jgi:3''-Phosphoadenosine 5''-phosphosulfate (PAPS) 3''-phosphatase
VVSEEQAERTPPAAGVDYFLVDPLDGTREFIAGRDEYTVNIALIADRTPALGVIVAPALGLIWRGIVGHGAERLKFAAGQMSLPEPIHTRAPPAGALVVMASRSHLDASHTALHRPTAACASDRLRLLDQVLPPGRRARRPLSAARPTHDWDVAAGHAILVAAGGSVVGRNGEALAYGTPELRIPDFLAWGSPTPTQPAKL